MSGNAVTVPGAPDSAAAPQSQADSAAALGGGGGGHDWGEALARQEAQLHQQGQLVTSLRGELDKKGQVLDRVAKAFSNEPERRLTPTQERGQRLQGLRQMLHRNREESLREGGNGLPVTVQIGEELADYAIQADARSDALEAKLNDLTQRLDKQQNPMFQGMERAAFIMEGMVEEGLTQLYGDTPETAGIRAAQYDAVTRRVNDEIRDIIKSDDRQALLKIQRNPKVMRNMVNHFMKEILPPKVREMMDAEVLANQPDDPGELLTVLNEARQKYSAALAADDNRQADFWSLQMDEIRQKYLAAKYGGRGQRGGGQGQPGQSASLLGSYVGGSVRK